MIYRFWRCRFTTGVLLFEGSGGNTTFLGFFGAAEIEAVSFGGLQVGTSFQVYYPWLSDSLEDVVTYNVLLVFLLNYQLSISNGMDH